MDGTSISSSDAGFNIFEYRIQLIKYTYCLKEVTVKKLTLILSGMCLMLLTFGAEAQNLKIGYVDSQKIFEGLPEAREAQEVLDARMQVWQDSLDLMSKEFQASVEAYQAQEGMMSETAKQQKQKELMRTQQVVQDYRQTKFGQNGEAAQMRVLILAPLQKQVLEAIKKIAKEENLHFVFDKMEEASILLYAQEKFDYTFKVLDMLKRGDK